MSNIFTAYEPNATFVFLLLLDTTDDIKKMWLYSIFFDRNSTTIRQETQQQTQQTGISSYDYDYTSLIAYDDQNFLFTTSNNCFLYKITGIYKTQVTTAPFTSGAISATVIEIDGEDTTGISADETVEVQMCVSENTTNIWAYNS
jgi:hypothetical protein